MIFHPSVTTAISERIVTNNEKASMLAEIGSLQKKLSDFPFSLHVAVALVPAEQVHSADETLQGREFPPLALAS